MISRLLELMSLNLMEIKLFALFFWEQYVEACRTVQNYLCWLDSQQRQGKLKSSHKRCIDVYGASIIER